MRSHKKLSGEDRATLLRIRDSITPTPPEALAAIQQAQEAMLRDYERQLAAIEKQAEAIPAEDRPLWVIACYPGGLQRLRLRSELGIE